MNIILRRITNNMYNADKDYIYLKEGNYKVFRNKYCIKHYYYDNLICYVDLEQKHFSLFNCGYKEFRLITAQLNYLENFYKNKDYKLVYRGD